jgi:hypothetical protein
MYVLHYVYRFVIIFITINTTNISIIIPTINYDC